VRNPKVFLHRDNIDLFNRRVIFNRRKLESHSKGSVAIVP
jgi:hypothetical protein